MFPHAFSAILKMIDFNRLIRTGGMAIEVEAPKVKKLRISPGAISKNET